MKTTLRALLGLILLAAPIAIQAQFDYTTNADNTITITGYNGPEGALAIPTNINGLTVVAIGNFAFAQRYGLTSVTIPSSVNFIGIGPFLYCSLLKAITVDAQNPFYSVLNGVLFDKGQTVLVEYPGGLGGNYSVPSSVVQIEADAFENCINLTSVTIPNSVTDIADGAFEDCISLTNVTMFGSLTDIGDNAFEDCTRLTSVTIPNSVTYIGNSAFEGCSGLTNVIIPGSVTEIGDGSFEECTNLTSVTIPGGVIAIGDAAFGVCSSLTNVTIANGVFFIGDFAFLTCTSLTNVTIPGTVINIENYAFNNCTGLTNVTIASGVTSIGDYAFNDCYSLNNVKIPGSVTNIGAEAFNDCYSLASVFFEGNAPSASADASVFSDYADTTVYYMASTAGWSSLFAGRPTVLWNPVIQTGGPSFGVQSDQFGFNITGTANIPIVVEACTSLASGVWIPVQSSTLTNGDFYFSESLQTNIHGRYYRISAP